MSLLNIETQDTAVDTNVDTAPQDSTTAPVENITSDSRPEFLKPKFKTVDDQAKAYVELEKKLGSFIGSPDIYEPDNDDLKNDETYLQMSLVAKELNMSNEAFNKIANKFKELTKSQNQQTEEQEIANALLEKTKLGNDANKIISGVNTWLNNNFEKEEIDIAKNIGKTADGIKFLNKIKDISTAKIFSNQPKADIGIDYSENIGDQLAKAVTSEKYNTDLNYRKFINDKYLEVYGK